MLKRCSALQITSLQTKANVFFSLLQHIIILTFLWKHCRIWIMTHISIVRSVRNNCNAILFSHNVQTLRWTHEAAEPFVKTLNWVNIFCFWQQKKRAWTVRGWRWADGGRRERPWSCHNSMDEETVRGSQFSSLKGDKKKLRWAFSSMTQAGLSRDAWLSVTWLHWRFERQILGHFNLSIWKQWNSIWWRDGQRESG